MAAAGSAASSADANTNDNNNNNSNNNLIQQLAALGFPKRRSREAINSIGSSDDLQSAINWLLGHGQEDKGGAVQFQRCKHLDDDSVSLVGAAALTFAHDPACSHADCSCTGEIWQCLSCNSLHCGRYGQRHGLQHSGETGHPLMISLSDLSIWCYSCDAYVEHPKLITLRAQMETLKFGGQGDALRRKPVMSSYDLEGIASYIAERQVRKIVVMCGEGISTAAGIPDFRTPGSGLYDNLRKFQLSKPEDMFTVDFFMQNPEPFYTLCQEMWPGKHHPTLTHFFILLLEKKGLLLRCYTQNIDSLETSAGLPAEKLVAAHGSFDGAHVCKRPARFSSFRICEPIEQADVEVPVEEMRSAVEKGADGWRALNVKFGGLCKPKIVFFGEDLPASFELCEKDFPECDLLLVMGTSLVVHPFAGLVSNVGEDTPRLLLNREPAGLAGLHGLPGGFQFHLAEQNYRDAFHAGDCDSGCRALAKLLGWEAELLALVETRGAADVQTAPWV
ncbi:unnamed protein product [Polarella glacialis]|uniref:ubiquitinyl hydrolase 1 n=1 Tax=Polarella glacialis TaxID=89957 RepID=A0A813KZI9_POLGL|nr:unnamed protein product [Polarella glacialis]